MWFLFLGKGPCWSMSQNTRWTSPSTWTTNSSSLTTHLMSLPPMTLSTGTNTIHPLYSTIAWIRCFPQAAAIVSLFSNVHEVSARSKTMKTQAIFSYMFWLSSGSPQNLWCSPSSREAWQHVLPMARLEVVKLMWVCLVKSSFCLSLLCVFS